MALSFSELRDAIRASRRVVDIECPDVGVIKLRQVDCDVGMRLASLAQGIDQLKDPADLGNAMSGFYVELLAASVIDDSGELCLNNDEGKSLLKGLRIDQLTFIGNAAVELNGMSSTKKN